MIWFLLIQVPRNPQFFEKKFHFSRQKSKVFRRTSEQFNMQDEGPKTKALLEAINNNNSFLRQWIGQFLSRVAPGMGKL